MNYAQFLETLDMPASDMAAIISRHAAKGGVAEIFGHCTTALNTHPDDLGMGHKLAIAMLVNHAWQNNSVWKFVIPTNAGELLDAILATGGELEDSLVRSSMEQTYWDIIGEFGQHS